MRRFLTATLAVFIASSASIQNAAASVRVRDADLYVKAQANSPSPDREFKIESVSTPFSEAAFASSSDDLATTHDELSEPMAGDPSPQATPTSPQTTPPAHHSHHLRNVIIIIAIGAALLIGLAAAAK